MEMFVAGKIPEQKIQQGKPFPKVFYPPLPQDHHPPPELALLLQKVRENREILTSELKDHGAILFRGFPISSPAEFESFVDAFGWPDQPYAGGASRVNVVGKVWTANEGPLDQHIFFHHEMALMKEVPSKLFFYCEVAPPEGGQTAVVQSHRVASHMRAKFPDVMDKQVITCLHMPNRDHAEFFLGKSWQTDLGTDDPVEAKRRVESRGGRIEWKEDGSANVTYGPLPVTRTFGGNDMWFNYIPAATYRQAASFNRLLIADGSSVSEEVLAESASFMDNDCVEVTWCPGDVLLIDNLSIMHGRRPSAPPRLVLVVMCK